MAGCIIGAKVLAERPYGRYLMQELHSTKGWQPPFVARSPVPLRIGRFHRKSNLKDRLPADAGRYMPNRVIHVLSEQQLERAANRHRERRRDAERARNLKAIAAE